MTPPHAAPRSEGRIATCAATRAHAPIRHRGLALSAALILAASAAQGEAPVPVTAAPEPGSSPAGAPAPLRQVALTVLRDALAAKGPVFSSELLTRIAAGSGLRADSAATGLHDLLDRLEAHRKAGDDTWKALTALGGDDLDARAGDRLLRQLMSWGRKATRGGPRGGKAGRGTARYSLDLVLKRSADKARLADWQARDLLRRALEWGLSGSAAGPGAQRAAPPVASGADGGAADLPHKVGLLVTGSSSYQVDLVRFRFLMLRPDDEDELDKVRDLHLAVTAALTRTLPRLPQVKWAIDRPHPNLRPDCRLRFEIDEFHLVDIHDGLPVMGLTIRFALEGAQDQAHFYAHTFDVTYDFFLEEDEQTRSQRRLDGLVARVARTLTDEVERYFATHPERG